MGKVLKIIGISFLALILAIGAISFFLYQNFKWIGKAENLGPAWVGSPPFNEKLVTCSPALGGGGSYTTEPWQIRGIFGGKCVVKYYKTIEETLEQDIQEGRIQYWIYTCKLPYEIYTEPEELKWSSFINSEYCSSNIFKQ